MNEILGITALILALWYWWDSMQAKEIARNAGRKACESADLQFLDDTVARKKIGLKRNTMGRINFYRLFNFEFTSIGDQRYKGTITMTGKFIENIIMEAHRIKE